MSNQFIKTLSAVEALPDRSNQHELNGVSELKKIFGVERFTQNARFSIQGKSLEATVAVTWYDAREDHPSRTEYRLYFQTNPVMQQAKEGDRMSIGYDSNNRLNLVLIPR